MGREHPVCFNVYLLILVSYDLLYPCENHHNRGGKDIVLGAQGSRSYQTLNQEQDEIKIGTQLTSSFYSIQNYSQWDEAAHIQGESLLR